MRALRNAEVRVSTSEEIDAAQALAVLGMPSRATVKAALRATLLKEPRDLPAFERLFAAFFDAPGSIDVEPDSERARAWAEIAAGLDGIARDLAEAMAAGDSSALEALFAEAHERIDLPLRFPFQRGLLTHRLRERLEVERIRRAMAAPGQGGGLASGTGKSGTGEAPPPMESLEEAIGRYVERALARAIAPRAAVERSGIHPLFELDERESDAIHRASSRLAEKLREQTARRKRRAKRGRIDVRATLRHSVGTGGVPFVPRWRRVRPDRPRLVALCDVSPSMRSATRFTLMFLHSIAAEVARVRSFFFVDRTAEVSGFFRERRIGRAVSRALSEADLDVGARTDYGASFRDFDRRFGSVLDKRTTLIVLGDARSNYTDPGIDVFRGWKRRARRVVFLNPEAPPFWATGDSVMTRYAPHCDVVAECRSPAHLDRVVEALAGRLTEATELPSFGPPR